MRYSFCLNGVAILACAAITFASPIVRKRATDTPTGELPSPSQFASDNGTKWTITYVGDLGFTGPLGPAGLQGDKCRTSSLGDQTLWNCGDMQCGSSVATCGFSMGPSFYGTDSVLQVDASAFSTITPNIFAEPWEGDPSPQAPQTAFGMDTSNVAAIDSTTGIAYVWEIWRGASDGSIVNQGSGVVSVTLGADQPVATRLGPLLTGPDAIQLGLFAILSGTDNYVYIYSIGGPSGMIVGRVPKSNNAPFDASQYQFLESASANSANPVWSNTGASSTTNYIPTPSTTTYSMYTSAGTFACLVYGSVFYSNYFQQYVIVCNVFESVINMYTAPNPWGPWSGTYTLLTGWSGYGSMAHPMYDQSGKSLWISMSPDGDFSMFKVTFDYDS